MLWYTVVATTAHGVFMWIFHTCTAHSRFIFLFLYLILFFRCGCVWVKLAVDKKAHKLWKQRWAKSEIKVDFIWKMLQDTRDPSKLVTVQCKIHVFTVHSFFSVCPCPLVGINIIAYHCSCWTNSNIAHVKKLHKHNHVDKGEWTDLLQYCYYCLFISL